MTISIERSMSTSQFGSQSAHEDHLQHDSSRLPPWEQRNRHNVVQVPFMSPTTPPLTETEHQALSSLWASKMSNQEIQEQNSKKLMPPYAGTTTWNAVGDAIPAAPWTAPAPPSFQSPYESVKIPHGPRTAPHVPAFVKAPPTPPEAFTWSRSSTECSHKPKSLETSPVLGGPTTTVPALPGTMFTRAGERERSHSRGRSGSSGNDKVEPHGFGKRFKTSFKNMFKRGPIDEAEFERIEDRHWTEE